MSCHLRHDLFALYFIWLLRFGYTYHILVGLAFVVHMWSLQSTCILVHISLFPSKNRPSNRMSRCTVQHSLQRYLVLHLPFLLGLNENYTRPRRFCLFLLDSQAKFSHSCEHLITYHLNQWRFCAQI